IEAQTPSDPDKVLTIDAPENTQAKNDNTQSQATDNKVSTQNNNQQQDNTQEQSQAKVLPETGEESSNTTLLTMVAAVVLAAGSLLTFKRFSKEK
ncbi:LPXTG cell wall anchor domain-containing protein, partial [Staphylococcus epidermidis]